MRVIANLFDREARKRAVGIALLVAAGCRHNGECIVIPGCPPPDAATITITSSASGAPVIGASVTVNGDGAHAVQCDGRCAIYGSAGKYVFDISAPGFASVEKTIIVTGTTKQYDVYGSDGFEGESCDCDVVNRQDLAFALDPTPEAVRALRTAH